MEELLVPKEEETQTDAEQPHAEVLGVETSTQAESSKDRQKRTREADRFFFRCERECGRTIFSAQTKEVT